MNVEAVELRTTSLIRLHHHLYEPSETPIVLCHLGHTQTVVSVATAGYILAHCIFKSVFQSEIYLWMARQGRDGAGYSEAHLSF